MVKLNTAFGQAIFLSMQKYPQKRQIPMQSITCCVER
ncbi:hypothetical protein HDE74_003079 [Janthinobacterium sp. K2Li3]|nr:hypothetical protein [Janthinobacterium sp. K2C7]MBB5382324.1 hypothetical protein [Janthinobacterium sp. K2Li3]MBB5387901.1 hypothetical protein [Janthinobacterium sp. K2E3]